MVNVIPLKWDSDFFGLRIAKIVLKSHDEAQSLLQIASVLKREYDLIYVFSRFNVSFFEGRMQLVDKKINYIASVDECCSEQSAVKQWAISEVSPDLLHLALLSGMYSRFNIDKHFSRGSYERLYSYWIQQSVNHSIATDVFCYMENEIPRGLLTLNVYDCIGTIGLVSVDEHFRQKGIGSSMIRHVFNYSINNQIKKLYVSTQSVNIPACRLYEKNGFVVDSVVNVWHWWLREETSETPR